MSPRLIITASCPRADDTLELDDVLSSVCLYAFIIVSIWLWAGLFRESTDLSQTFPLLGP